MPLSKFYNHILLIHYSTYKVLILLGGRYYIIMPRGVTTEEHHKADHLCEAGEYAVSALVH